jgi:hypothetical protein
MPKKNRITTTMSTMAIIKFRGTTTFNAFMKICIFFFPMATPANVAMPTMACIRRTMANTRPVTINFLPIPQTMLRVSLRFCF